MLLTYDVVHLASEECVLFNERVVDVVPDGRLRLRANTMGTRDDSVKFLGVRARRSFDVGTGLCIAVTLDWNDQQNGSYLSAGLIVAEEETDGNPVRGENWLAVEYVGVPPGRKARMQIRSSRKGRVRTLEDEGWPDEQRTGRTIGEAHLRLWFAPDSFRLWEDDRLVHTSQRPSSLERVFLYLQLSSHSNYPAREIYFDDDAIGPASNGTCDGRPSR